MSQAAQELKGSEVAERQWNRYVRARDAGHRHFIEAAERYRSYYEGDQWEEKVRKKLEDEGRPALTINMVLSTINAMLGEYTNRQASLSYKPKHNGTFDRAQILTKLAQHILDENDYESVEWDCVTDGLIPGRGFLDVRLDFEQHMQGDVRIRALDPTEVVLDPDAKEYDPDTWTEVIRTFWSTPDEIEVEFGKDKRDEVEGLVSRGSYYGYDSFEFDRNRFGQDHDPSEFHYRDDTDRDIRSIRVVSRQHRKVTKASFFVDPQSGDLSAVPMGWSNERRDEFAERMGLFIHRKPTQRIRWTVTVDKVVLHDDWSPYETFTIIPFFPYFQRGRPFGAVENLVGSQDHLNKTTSQELHVINTTANSGWTAEEGTLVNMTEDELTERGAETGLVLVHARGSNPPQKIQPNQVPTGLDLMSNKSRQFLREISGLEGVLGISSPEISGVALEGKNQRANVQLAVPFMNLARTRRILGRKILELVQRFYTENRLITIVRKTPGHDEQSTEQIEINKPDEFGDIANDITLGRYGVAVATQPSRDNFDDVQFAEAMQLRQNGVAVPDHIIVRYSRLADRDELSELLAKQVGAAEPTEQELQLQQQQQELAIQTAQAELEKLVSESQEIQSRAQLNAAKAEQEGAGIDSAENQLKLQDLEAKIRMKREELQTRLQLAQMTHSAGREKAAAQGAVQLATAQKQGDTQLQTTLLNLQGRSQR